MLGPDSCAEGQHGRERTVLRASQQRLDRDAVIPAKVRPPVSGSVAQWTSVTGVGVPRMGAPTVSGACHLGHTRRTSVSVSELPPRITTVVSLRQGHR
jgi:hypothetical protein